MEAQIVYCRGKVGPRSFEVEVTEVETANGDSPLYTSSNPSPERIDEACCGKSPLEKSIADPEE
jgi:hypothetical protein